MNELSVYLDRYFEGGNMKPEDLIAGNSINYEKLLEEGRKQGRQEVVDWIHNYSELLIVGQDIAQSAGNEIKGDTSYYPIIKLLEWQAQLKTWGIE